MGARSLRGRRVGGGLLGKARQRVSKPPPRATRSHSARRKPACCFVLLPDRFPTQRKVRGAFDGISSEKGQSEGSPELGAVPPGTGTSARRVPSESGTAGRGPRGSAMCFVCLSEEAPWATHIVSIAPRGASRRGGQAPASILQLCLETVLHRKCGPGDSSLQKCIFNLKCYRLVVPFFLFPWPVCGRGKSWKGALLWQRERET